MGMSDIQFGIIVLLVTTISLFAIGFWYGYDPSFSLSIMPFLIGFLALSELIILILHYLGVIQ